MNLLFSYFQIDGLVFNGKIRLIWPSIYFNTVANFSSNSFIAGCSLNSKHPHRIPLQKYIEKVLLALSQDVGPPTFSFHAEGKEILEFIQFKLG
jgi:hypothetical protein